MPIRIIGPYPHRGRVRFRIQTGPGAYSWAGAGETEHEARLLAEARAQGLQDQVDLTVGGLVDRYLEWLRAMDRKPGTVETARNKLQMILGPLMHLESASVTVHRARARYADLAAEAAAATHHIALGRARSLWKWAIRQGLVRSNPWLEVDKTGRPKRGKPQLRIDEARRLADVCMSAVMESDGALAILVAQFLALRSSEIVQRDVRDADDDCRLLWIPDAKTPAGKRIAEIPESIQDATRARVKGRKPTEPLFRKYGGGRPSRSWFGHQLRSFCAAAGVPIISPHALRGQWATIAVESGALSHMVAAQLGHASFAVTAAHYAKPGSVERAQQTKRTKLLQGRRT